jgi:hypothetical protein
MWQRLDAVAVPDDFTLIAKAQQGSRESFMAIGEPSVTNRYGVRWDESVLCERLRQLLADDGRAVAAKSYGKACTYTTTISAGWKAKLVNVWTYELAAYAAPDASQTGLTPSECAEIRKQHEQAYGPNDYFRGVPQCWLEPGHALVTIYVEGKQGWVPLSILRSTPPPDAVKPRPANPGSDGKRP